MVVGSLRALHLGQDASLLFLPRQKETRAALPVGISSSGEVA
jgi:hypothetical protein